MRKLSPTEAIEVYKSLFEVIDAPLSSFCPKDMVMASQMEIDFDPTEFSKEQLVQLLRVNSQLQYALEQLTHIIELVPHLYLKYKIY